MSGLLKLTTLALAAPEDVTIASNVAIVTQSAVNLIGEGVAADDLVTITLNSAVNIETYLHFVVLLADADTITVKHGTGNILLNGAADFSLTSSKALLLWFDGTNYHDLGA